MKLKANKSLSELCDWGQTITKTEILLKNCHLAEGKNNSLSLGSTGWPPRVFNKCEYLIEIDYWVNSDQSLPKSDHILLNLSLLCKTIKLSHTLSLHKCFEYNISSFTVFNRQIIFILIILLNFRLQIIYFYF